MLSGYAGASPVGNLHWRGFDARCPLCIDAKRERASLPSPPPDNAIVYYVVGEFASAPSMWMIDVDRGVISRVPFQHVAGTPATAMPLDAASLKLVREAAAAVWQQRTQNRPTTIPGGSYALELFSGDRVLSLDPFDPRSKRLVSSIESAADTLGEKPD